MWIPRITRCFFLLMVGLSQGATGAQEVRLLNPGDRVRVTAEGCSLDRDVGTVISVSDEALSASWRGRESVRICRQGSGP
jgi:hypothetical protein